MCHEIFYLHFLAWFAPIWAPDKQAKVFYNSFRFYRDIRSQSSKNSTPRCVWHCRVKKFCSANKFFFFLQIFFFMIFVFTPKRISPDCPFESNQRLSKISILTPQCAFWLWRVMHTAELNSPIRCTPRSSTPQNDAHRGVWLCSAMLFKNSNIEAKSKQNSKIF